MSKLNEGSVTSVYDFSHKKVLGQGQFGKVWSVKSLASNEDVAVKEIKLAKNKLNRTMREIETMEKANHDGIIKLHEYFKEDGARGQCSLYLIQDLCLGGNLLAHLMLPTTTVTGKEAKDIFAHLMFAMEYLHSIRIAHRDLKPDNLMLVAPGKPLTTKIGDFGFAKELEEDGNTETQLGTFGYVAPEVMSRKKGYKPYMADMFSMGVILYELLSKRPPWVLGPAANEACVAKWCAKRHDEQFPAKFGFDAHETGATDLVKEILVLKPEGRLTAQQILRHPWLADAIGVAEWKSENQDDGASAEAPVSADAEPKPPVQPRNPGGQSKKPEGDAGGCCSVQ